MIKPSEVILVMVVLITHQQILAAKLQEQNRQDIEQHNYYTCKIIWIDLLKSIIH